MTRRRPARFNSIVDALMDLPTTANYVRYANLNASSTVTNWTMVNLGGNMPNASLFGKMPLKDVSGQLPVPHVGPDDRRGPAGRRPQDFGPSFDNASYQKTTIDGAQLRLVNSVLRVLDRQLSDGQRAQGIRGDH